MEKFDGIRAIWTPDAPDGPNFKGRGGSYINTPPPSLAALLQKYAGDLRLDGELWGGRQKFHHVGALMGSKSKGPEVFEQSWRHLKYMVFDAPQAGGTYLERLAVARERLADAPTERIQVVSVLPCEDSATKERLLQRVVDVGGEGLVLRKASSYWRAGSDKRNMLKAKPWFDAEAVVRFHNSQKDSLSCKGLNIPSVDADGRLTTEPAETQPKFDITWHRKRERPPPPGAIITFHYRWLHNGCPSRHALLRVHDPETCLCAVCEHGLPIGWEK